MNLLTVKKYLFKSNLTPLQDVQLKYMTSILKDFLIPLICNYSNVDKIKEQLTDIEKFYLGFKPNPTTIVEKLSVPLYVITRFFIASSGPRFGSIYEDIILSLLKSRNYEAYNRVNIFTFPLFRKYVNEERGKKIIDFIIRNNNEIYLVEQRTSEHSGGRTAQESLLDKFKILLEWFSRDPKPLLENGIGKVHMVIFISFSESHEILNDRNFNKGRFTSLASYVVENLSEKFKLLISAGFKTDCKSFEECIKSRRKIEFHKDDFDISFEILFGEEFFTEILRETYENVKDKILSKELGDDLWLIYTILPYELRLYYEEGFMWSKKIYEKIKVDQEFRNLLASRDVEKLVEYVSKKILEEEKEIRLLETNDLKTQYEYLKALSSVALIIYSLGCVRELNLK